MNGVHSAIPARSPDTVSPEARLLEVSDLVVGYDGRPLLDRIGFDIRAGETLALVGESGSGKSTTALAIGGLLPDNASVAGKVLFEGSNLIDLSRRARRRIQGSRIGFVFQEPLSSLNPVMRIGDQIVEVLREHEPLGRREASARALALLDRVEIPHAAQVLRGYPHQLSGGQRQRVMIAMAIACHPRLLIADEPTTALDVTTQARILALLDQLRRELDMGLLLISHDLGIVSEHADGVVVMHAGKVMESTDTGRLFAKPEHPYTRGLLGASLRKDDPRHYSRERLAEIRVDTAADGTHTFSLTHTGLAAVNPPGPATGGSPGQPAAPRDGAPLLEARGLRKTFHNQGRSLVAVRDVSFTLHAGETLGLVGQSGSGKSTLGRILLRLIRQDAGSLHYRGQDISALPEHRLRPFRRQVQMIFQDPFGSLNPRQTLGDMLDGIQRLHLGLDRPARQREARTLIDAVGLPADSLHRYPHEFSGGQRQRIGIARALVLKPALIICDEPVSALDVSVQAQVLNLLADLRREYGLSYLFISHDLAVIRYISDRVMVMREGSIVESGRHDELWEAPRHPYTRSLIEAIPGRRPGLESGRLRATRPAARPAPARLDTALPLPADLHAPIGSFGWSAVHP